MSLVLKNYTKLTKEQSLDILNIRNKKEIREKMTNSEIISKENHLKWMQSLSSSQDRYFAIFSDETLLGSLSFVKRDKKVSWGVFFEEGTNILILSSATYIFLDFIFTNISDIIYSEVKIENSKALSFNKSLGFCLQDEDDDYFYLSQDKKAWEEHKNSRFIKPIKKYLNTIEYKIEG
ncbi:hypothetical protein CRV08_12255 [Halarcobacter ebronensis]|uniref:UDP-4-amino-4, 6-dideoxy-N-acetyl-beta-L-altrosamine N-acetyltransferase n=1 Tax=Halarcobacter ebronensis TaxID=1462615 RepID=A0A4Q0YD64_9BACT|nr:GNAT family N-acetyltransferase [Halarcobacter ebronensis]RXJ66831.1 hypothetical protein CRV08_12255 [Halarcobacter ebronensis]